VSNTRSPELTEAIAYMIQQQPFFAVLMLDLLEVVETTSLPTAATDGKRLMVNPDFIKKKCKNTKERAFVLAHEVLHVILRHPYRLKLYMDLGMGPDLKPFSKSRANQAMDYVINDALVHDQVGLPPHGVLLNPQYTKDMIWDEVYEKLPEDDSNQEWDEHMPGDPSTAPTDADVARAVASAANAAKNMGKMPGSMQRLVNEILEPEIPWEEHLARTFSMVAARDANTWARPNRRRLAVPPHIYMPGRAGYATGPVVVGVDTSGSISDKETSTYLGAIQNLFATLPPESVHVMFVDAQVHDTIEVSDISEVADLKHKVKGGGGTDMTAIYREIDKLGLQPTTCVILTDGYTPFGEAQQYPTLWCITTDQKAPHGETIHVKVPH
jgi:predicted metal-dependent peptidase